MLDDQDNALSARVYLRVPEIVRVNLVQSVAGRTEQPGGLAHINSSYVGTVHCAEATSMLLALSKSRIRVPPCLSGPIRSILHLREP